MDFVLENSVLVIVSILLTAACFNVALYFGYGKKLAYLFFAFYCVFHCFKIYLKSYPQDQVLVSSLGLNAYQLIYLSVILGMLSLSTFLAHYFRQAQKKWFIGIYVAVAIFFFVFIEELVFIKLSLAVALGQVLYASFQVKNTLFIFLGVLGFILCVSLGGLGLLSYGYFVGVIVLIFSMVLASSIELARQNKEYQNALLRATSLENQLLKTTIQPHFILNSLTSLQELIETDAKKASGFVFDLSRVFELFSKISNQKLIPIHQELELVSSYLDIMSQRKNMEFELKLENIQEEDTIPPGVLLTLVENGITHGYENRTEGVFQISKESNGPSQSYTVVNDGNTLMNIEKQGTGHKYVIARLQESYDDRFAFESHPSPMGWTSKITIWD